MKKTVAVGIAGVAALVVAAWRQIQRDNSLATDESRPESSPPPPPRKPEPASQPDQAPSRGQSLFSPSVDENSTKAELYKVATELKIEGRSKMNKSELMNAIRAAS